MKKLLYISFIARNRSQSSLLLIALFLLASLNQHVFAQCIRYTTSGVYSYTLPSTGPFNLIISAKGGDGGNSDLRSGRGGSGALVKGQFTFQPADILTLIVGQAGSSNQAGGGGGGSAIVLTRGGVSSLLIAAGGGAGAGDDFGQNGEGGRGLNRSDHSAITYIGASGGGLASAGANGNGNGGGQASLTIISSGGAASGLGGKGGNGFGGGGSGATDGLDDAGGGGGGYGGGSGGPDALGGEGGSSYAAAGLTTSQVILDVSGGGIQADGYVEITGALALSASNSGILTCANPSLTLTATATSGSNYTYSFAGPGLSTTSTSNSAPISQAGTFTVLVQSVEGCSASTTIAVSGSTTVVGPVTVVASGCAPNNVTLTASSTGATSYSLLPGGNNNSTGIFLVTTAGTYTVIASNGLAGCQSQTMVTISQGTNAVAGPITASGPASCGSPARLTAPATGQSFIFTGPGGYVFSNTYRNGGSYSVFAEGVKLGGTYTLTVYGSEGCPTATSTVVVQGPSSCP